MFRFIIGCCLLLFAGCIEIQDRNRKEAQPVPKILSTKNDGDLNINEPMYVHNGRILNAVELQMSLNSQLSTDGHDFEFNFENVNFGKNGQLYTMGNNVRFHFKNLESQSGVIATFPDQQKAPLGIDGRSGGHILIEILDGSGFLNVIMRGEGGGKGLSGAPLDPSRKPNKAENGKDGNSSCTILPEIGHPGATGFKGNPGWQGRKGGDSGTLELRKSANAGRLFVSYSKFPGAGGEGGEGGRGGDGGDKGNAGKVIGNCDTAMVQAVINDLQRALPAKGNEGEKGDQGSIGEGGKEQIICIIDERHVPCF